MRIGFIGAGNMAGAMARGWAGAEGGPESISFSDPDRERATALAQEVGASVAEGNGELARSVDAVVLAVKPGLLEAVAAEIAGEAPAVISILGATPLARLESALPGTPILRVIPNVAVEVRRGVLCYAAGTALDASLRERLVELLSALGHVAELDDRVIDAATAVMSCSPAYVALVAEALADAGVAQGLDASVSNRLAVEAIGGTAELLRSHDTLAVRRAVASPGGSTAAGLAALERGGVRAALGDAVRASLERMRA